MKEAADAEGKRSKQLKEGLKITILVFAGQIPILLGFIILNRTCTCFCLSNLVWLTSAIVCFVLTYFTF
jgi:antibiotic biosynthesis monooxygenase (ABM) superfamily enzyme